MDQSKTGSLLLNKNLHIIFAITLIAVLGVSSITPAFPKIATELNISKQAIGLLITVFTLPGVILTPLLGILADRKGRKKILVPSLFLYGIAGGACALTSDFHILLGLRFIQGIGAASLGSLNVTLIGDLFEGRDRIAAMGYNSSVLSVGTASYPAIGGAVALFGWHYPFLLALAAIPVGLAAMVFLKNPEPRSSEHFKNYLKSAWKEIKKWRVLALFLLSMCTFIILYGIFLTYLPIFMSNKFGSDSFTIGLILTTSSVASAITSSQLGRISKHLGEIKLLFLGFVLTAITMVLLPLMPHIYYLGIPAVIYGISLSFNIPVNLSLLTGMASTEYRAIFMSFNGMVLRLGQTLGPLLAGMVFLLGGFNFVFGFGVIVVAIMFLLIITAYIFNHKEE